MAQHRSPKPTFLRSNRSAPDFFSEGSNPSWPVLKEFICLSISQECMCASNADSLGRVKAFVHLAENLCNECHKDSKPAKNQMTNTGQRVRGYSNTERRRG